MSGFDPTTLQQQGSFSASQGYTSEEWAAKQRKAALAATPNQELVRRFHNKMGFLTNETPTRLTWREMMFRDDLIMEECDELRHELGKASPDIVKIAHEAADLLYVLYGLAVEMGFDLDAVMREVHVANMQKLPSLNGSKARKPADWQPADVASVVGVK